MPSDHAGVDKSGNQFRQNIIWHRQQHKVRTRNDVRNRHQWNIRQKCLCPELGHIGHSVDTHNVMSGPGQSGTEHSANPTGADNADPEPWRPGNC